MLHLMNVKVPLNSEILWFSGEVVTSGALADAPKYICDDATKHHQEVLPLHVQMTVS